MADEPYEIEPADDEPERTPSEPAGGEDSPKAELDEPGLRDDFDEDADFTHDPAVEAALGKPEVHVVGDEPVDRDALPEFVVPGLGPAKLWGIIGCLFLMVALIASAVNAPDKTIARMALTLYHTAVHTGTGVVAVLVAAFFLEKRVTRFDLAGARMFAAVAAFVALVNLNIDIAGGTKIEEILLATIAYLVIVWVTFRLDRTALFIVAGAHFGLWLVVQIGLLLAASVSQA
jgi:hypothetical protein